MDVVKLHQLIDEWAAEERAKEQVPEITTEAVEVVEEPKRELPEGKRLVYTKESGDRRFLIDEVKKTRQWVTKPELLEGLGLQLDDAVLIEKPEFERYQQGSPIYRDAT